MSRLKISFFVFLVSAVVFPVVCSGDIRIDITKTAFRKISVAVADFSGRGDLGKKAAGVINADLGFSGYFAPVSNRDFLRDAAAGGLDFKYIPTDGSNHQVALMLGKHIDVATLNPGEVKEQDAAGNFRVLGMGHSERIEEFPHWPTFKEQGFDVTVITSPDEVSGENRRGTQDDRGLGLLRPYGGRIKKIQDELGYSHQVSMENGLRQMVLQKKNFDEKK